MKIIPPSYVGVVGAQESIGLSGCGVYVGVIMLFKHVNCVCNFTSPEQVAYFFQVLSPRLHRGGALLKVVYFCELAAMADKIVLMLQCFVDCTSIPYYACDAMYVERGKIYPGLKVASAEELLGYFCHDYNASFTWLLGSNTGLRIWDPRAELKSLN